MMKNKKLLDTNPLYLSIICGISSAAFSYSSIFIINGPALFAPLFLLNYLWLSPLLLVGLHKGLQYGGVASLIVVGIHLLTSGFMPTAILSIGSLIPALYMMYLLSPSLFDGWGRVCSQICLLYLGILIFSLIFIFDFSSIQAVSTSFLSGIPSPQREQISESFAHYFPTVIGLSLGMSLALNTWVTLRILKKSFPDNYSYISEQSFKLPPYWDIVFLIGLLLILTGNEMFAFMGRNILLLSCVPLYLDGLDIIYCWFKPLEKWIIWFSLTIILSLVLVWPAMLIVFSALLKPVLQITKRLK